MKTNQKQARANGKTRSRRNVHCQGVNMKTAKEARFQQANRYESAALIHNHVCFEVERGRDRERERFIVGQSSVVESVRF